MLGIEAEDMLPLIQRMDGMIFEEIHYNAIVCFRIG